MPRSTSSQGHVQLNKSLAVVIDETRLERTDAETSSSESMIEIEANETKPHRSGAEDEVKLSSTSSLSTNVCDRTIDEIVIDEEAGVEYRSQDGGTKEHVTVVIDDDDDDLIVVSGFTNKKRKSSDVIEIIADDDRHDHRLEIIAETVEKDVSKKFKIDDDDVLLDERQILGLLNKTASDNRSVSFQANSPNKG